MPMFTLMPHVLAKFTKYMIRTFFGWKSGYRTKIIFLQLWLPKPMYWVFSRHGEPTFRNLPHQMQDNLDCPFRQLRRLPPILQ